MKKLILIIFIANCTLQIAIAQPTQEWVARYERPSGSSGIANQMALDKVGNCYILGNAPVNGSYGGIILIKYNSTGDTLWTRSYNQGAGNAAGHVNLVADSIGNVYITGRTGIGSFGPYDIVTVKFNPQGVQQWLKIYDNGTSDEPADITMDKLGNVYICGFSGNESLIIKYNQNGDTVLTRKYSAANYFFAATSIALDNQNNILIGGSRVHTTNGGIEYFTIKYDSNAVFQWANTASISQLSSFAKVKADLNGNIVTTGRSGGVIYTLKYGPTGLLLWQKIYEGPGSGGHHARDMEIDRQNNIIITGYSSGVGTGIFDYVTIKYDPNGDSLWVNRYNGNQNDNDEAYSLALDDSNNIYVTGRSRSIGQTWNYATIKYDQSGSEKWVRLYNGPPGNGEDIAFKVSVSHNNDVFVTGISDRGSFIYDYVTIKYSQPLSVDPIITELPNEYKLEQNYPNPFNPITKIKYQIINDNTTVRLVVFDITGKEVDVLVDKVQNIGNYEITFKPENLASGIYFCKLISEEYTDTKKMILIR